jgi:hypothetical protein
MQITELLARRTDLSANAVSAWVDTYCREHPLDNLTVAAEHLVEELSTPK